MAGDGHVTGIWQRSYCVGGLDRALQYTAQVGDIAPWESAVTLQKGQVYDEIFMSPWVKKKEGC